MIYEFIEESDHLHLTDRPAESMQYNGVYLEDLVAGYKTVNVKGRETLAVAIGTSGKMPQRDGERIQEVTVQTREIVITYSLVAETNEAFRIAYDTMKHHLLWERDPVPIRFDDEPEYTYCGIAFSVPEVDPGLNTVLGEIRIYCADPYKYSDPVSITGTGAVSALLDGMSFPFRPTLKVTLASNAAKINLSNLSTGKNVILNGNYSSGDVILVNIPDSTITRNGGNIKSHLDFVESDFFNFLVKEGDQLGVSPNTATLELIYRRRLL